MKPQNIIIDPFLTQSFNDGYAVVAQVSTLRQDDGYIILKEFKGRFKNAEEAKCFIDLNKSQQGLEIFRPESSPFEVSAELDKDCPF
jgi:hypothetical protein